MEKKVEKVTKEGKDLAELHEFAVKQIMPLVEEMARNDFESKDVIICASMIAVDIVALVFTRSRCDTEEEVAGAIEDIFNDAKEEVINVIQQLP